MTETIRKISPLAADAQELFQLLDQHNMSHCSPEVCHLTQPEELERIHSVLLGVYEGEALVGMGGLKLYPEYAEVTRMYLRPEVRGRGIAARLLGELEALAKSEGYPFLRLETSEKFKAAFQLYLKYGFELCAPFGEYVNKPYNTYMEKRIV